MKLIQLHDGTVVNLKRIRFARTSTNSHGVKRLLIFGKGNEASIEVSGTEEEVQADLRLLSSQGKEADTNFPMLVYMNIDDRVRVLAKFDVSRERFYELAKTKDSVFDNGEYIGTAYNTTQLIQLINNFK